MMDRPEQEDLVKGMVQLDNYKGSYFELNGWEISSVLDDILMVQYTDINEDGDMVKRGSMWVPINAVNHVWRIGKVLLAGPNSKSGKQGDHIVFPNDRGMQVSNLNGLKHIVFLNEDRIFGIVKTKTEEKPDKKRKK